MPDYQETVNLDGAGEDAYAAAANIDLRNVAGGVAGPSFTPDVWTIDNTSVDCVVHVSFDGTNDHFTMTPNEPTEALEIQRKVTRLWLRRDAAAYTAPCNIIVMASSTV
jgi:hypothetical protein